MYTINPKYKNVKYLIHNFDGVVKHLRDFDLVIEVPKSPKNPVASRKIYPAASQEDLAIIVAGGHQDIVLITPETKDVWATRKKDRSPLSGKK